jgi:SAM-dependent methyltransferase
VIENFGAPKLSDVKNRMREAQQKANNSTEHAPGGETYPVLNSGLDDYARTLFDEENTLTTFLEQTAARKHNEPIRVLDYGCGTNRFSRELVERYGHQIALECVGVSAGDPRTAEERGIDKERAVIFINQKDPTISLPGQFDLIVSQTTFIHLPDPLRSLKMLYNALNKGGEIHIDHSLEFLAGNFYDGKNADVAFEQANDFITHLRSLGVGVELLENGMIIRKGPARLEFKGLHYTFNEAGLNEGQYTFDGTPANEGSRTNGK